ncbi:hypothetical protein BpHYR1_008259 [Brachionus plicatilis]|uniref:Uncharacterized protein n=1 Tax=Brachionus plicatilis TaxID=10195 RepID=A0A3M7S6Q2_BRAPC|nr:hypothetical protein BpHYR1_008259 [Brachionus plicatilis]
MNYIYWYIWFTLSIILYHYVILMLAEFGYMIVLRANYNKIPIEIFLFKLNLEKSCKVPVCEESN